MERDLLSYKLTHRFSLASIGCVIAAPLAALFITDDHGKELLGAAGILALCAGISTSYFLWETE